jgi:hypothetical protein
MNIRLWFNKHLPNLSKYFGPATGGPTLSLNSEPIATIKSGEFTIPRSISRFQTATPKRQSPRYLTLEGAPAPGCSPAESRRPRETPSPQNNTRPLPAHLSPSTPRPDSTSPTTSCHPPREPRASSVRSVDPTSTRSVRASLLCHRISLRPTLASLPSTDAPSARPVADTFRSDLTESSSGWIIPRKKSVRDPPHHPICER